MQNNRVRFKEELAVATQRPQGQDQNLDLIVTPSKYAMFKTNLYLIIYHPDSMTFFATVCFMVIKFVQELYITELPQVSKFLYQHSGAWVGMFLFISIIYVLPCCFEPILLAKKLQDRYNLILGFGIVILGILIKINFNIEVPQHEIKYYLGAIVFFSGSLIAEASSIAIMSKVISPKMKVGFWNAGLLSTCTDTAGRFMGNFSYSLIAKATSVGAVTLYAYLIDLGIVVPLFVLSMLFVSKLTKIKTFNVWDYLKVYKYR